MLSLFLLALLFASASPVLASIDEGRPAAPKPIFPRARALLHDAGASRGLGSRDAEWEDLPGATTAPQGAVETGFAGNCRDEDVTPELRDEGFVPAEGAAAGAAPPPPPSTLLPCVTGLAGVGDEVADLIVEYRRTYAASWVTGATAPNVVSWCRNVLLIKTSRSARRTVRRELFRKLYGVLSRPFPKSGVLRRDQQFPNADALWETGLMWEEQACQFYKNLNFDFPALMEFIARQTDRFGEVFPEGLSLLDADGIRSFTEDQALVLASMQLFNRFENRPTKGGQSSYSDTSDGHNPYHYYPEVAERLPSVHYHRLLMMGLLQRPSKIFVRLSGCFRAASSMDSDEHVGLTTSGTTQSVVPAVLLTVCGKKKQIFLTLFPRPQAPRPALVFCSAQSRCRQRLPAR